MRKIYVDTCILVAYFSHDPKEASRKLQIVGAFKVLSNLEDIKLYISMWTITEFIKVMINVKGRKPKEVNQLANELVTKAVVEGLELNLIEVSPNPEYSFDDFFYHAREIMALYNPGFGDAFHSTIMRNHNIKEILSIDGKDDFKILPGFIVIAPKIFFSESPVAGSL